MEFCMAKYCHVIARNDAPGGLVAINAKSLPIR